MKYKNIREAVFLRRLNRFIAVVLINGEEATVHVKNTGRCKELLIEGVRVLLEPSENPLRKTSYSLVSVYKGERLINMDSQSPNRIVAEAVSEGRISEIGRVDFLKREVTFGASRFDMYFEAGGRKGFIEVKGVTLEKDGAVYFPDAPTLRGKKHLTELIKAREDGYEAYVFFAVQMKGVKFFAPNLETDPDFGKELKRAAQAGVNILAYDCNVERDGLEISEAVPIRLP